MVIAVLALWWLILADHTLVTVELLSWLLSPVRPSVRLSVRLGCIVAKRCEIWQRLLLFTNRKWHTPCRIRGKSLTLDDFEDHRQPVRSAILATAGFLVFFFSCFSLSQTLGNILSNPVPILDLYLSIIIEGVYF